MYSEDFGKRSAGKSKLKMQNTKLSNICAVLPAHNEQKHIAGLTEEIRNNKIDVIVIDDGSTDDTYQLAKESGASVIRHSKKMGKGAALKDGLAWAMDKGYDYIITMDADGQHNPAELPLFVKEADENEDAKIIIGNRLLDPKDMPLLRICTNKFMSYLISALCKQNIPDTQCGYKLIKKEVLKIISIKSRKFEIESELLIKTARAHFRIKSIPIASIYAQEKSRINPFMDSLRFIKFVLKTIIKR